MRHIKETAVAAAAILLCLSGTAGAEYIDSAYYNYTSGQVEINGKFFDSFNGKYATVIVLKDGGDIANIDDSLVEKLEQVKIENGNFAAAFALSNSENGKYTAYVEAGGKSRAARFAYAKNIDEIFNEITSQTTNSDFASKIEQYADELNISDSIYGSISDKAAASKMAYAEKSKADNADKLRDLIKAYSYVEALNESKTELLHDGYNIIDETVLGFDTLDKDYGVTAYSLYKNSVNDTGRAKALDELKGKSFKNLDEMKKAFIYNASIAALKYNKNGGTAHVKGVLEDNNSVNGFDITSYKKQSGNAIDLKLINGNEWSKSDIQKILNMSSSDSSTNQRGDVSPGGGRGNNSGNTIGGGKQSGDYSRSYDVKQNDNGSFADMDKAPWAKDAVDSLSKLGIINGRDKNTFAPMENVTRAEFLKMIISAFKLDSDTADMNFPDISEDNWYYEYVKTAFALGIANGYDNGYFGANDNITRQDAAVIMARAAQTANVSLDEKNDVIDFTDNAEISDYAMESINRLVMSGILHGSDDGRFCPRDNCTRAQAAVMISNILGQKED